MKTNRIITVLASVLLIASCSNDYDISIPSVSGNDSTIVSIEASITNGLSEVQSRAVNLTNTFPYGESIGLWFTITGTYDAYNPLKNNMRAVWTKHTDEEEQYGLTADHWTYNYDNNTRMTFPTMFVAANKYTDINTMSRKMDVYAYAPHQHELESPEAISFVVNQGAYSNQTDYMYALQNLSSNSPNNRGKDVNGHELTIPLTFRHVMAAIKVKISAVNKTFNNSSVSVVTKVKLRKKEGGTTHLYASGTYNAVDGSISYNEASDSDSLVWTAGDDATQCTIDSVKSAEIYLLVPPTTNYGDGDYVLSFTIDGKGMTVENNGTTNVYEYSIPRSLFKVSENEYKLQSGYQYTMEFTYDNYIHFKGAYIDETWTGNHDGLFDRRY